MVVDFPTITNIVTPHRPLLHFVLLPTVILATHIADYRLVRLRQAHLVQFIRVWIRVRWISQGRPCLVNLGHHQLHLFLFICQLQAQFPQLRISMQIVTKHVYNYLVVLLLILLLRISHNILVRAESFHLRCSPLSDFTTPTIFPILEIIVEFMDPHLRLRLELS